MTTLSAFAGVIIFTRPLEFNAATRFAKCIEGNDQYRNVEVVPHPRSRGKYQVRYTVTDAARAAKLVAAQEASREVRAEAQADQYELRAVENGAFIVTEVINLLSGAVYSVQPNGSCDCPDAKYRTAGNCLCKHAILVRNYAQAEREAQHLSNLPPAPVKREETLAEYRARVARNLENDFPAAA